jgi:hypothetical protein
MILNEKDGYMILRIVVFYTVPLRFACRIIQLTDITAVRL